MPGREANYPNSLPEPENVSLRSLRLFDIAPEQIGNDSVVSLSRPVERINGVYLDILEPTSVTQGWGTLKKNQSVWEKPMTIGGHKYPRGLGTHAPSRITYALDGKFSRFQAWAGPDGATTPTVSFEVLVDGKSLWKSNNMGAGMPAQWVDVDVRNGKVLELLVGDGGNGLGGDHADWAMARLLY
jgi:alpha-galactosidase